MAEEIRAPLAGRIAAVLVSEGEAVEQGEELLLLEALKMESSLYAPADGTVRDIRVRPGQSVEADAVLLVLE